MRTDEEASELRKKYGVEPVRDSVMYCHICKTEWSKVHHCKEQAWNERKDIPFRISLTKKR